MEERKKSVDEGALGKELLKSWPSHLAYGVAFVHVGVIWLNHHYVFVPQAKTDIQLNFVFIVLYYAWTSQGVKPRYGKIK